MISMRAVIFDFDLTLADSTAGVVDCVNYAFDQMALPRAEPSAIRATIGHSLPATLAELTGLRKPCMAEAFTRHFVLRADLKMAELTVVFPEVAPVVNLLKSAKIKTAIVSTKFRYRIETILQREGLLGSFDTIVGGEDVTAHKPDPEGLLTALRRLAVRANESLYIGDHPIDAEAAAAGEIPFAAVLSGAAVRRDFEPWPVKSFLTTLSDLAPVLGRSRSDLGASAKVSLPNP
jgi:phosphoglycolate phosphatase